MAESPLAGRPSLLAWCLGTLDVVLLVVVAVLGLHATSALADLLAGLNTLVGVVAFLLLWALFVVAVGWVLADASLTESSLWTLAIRGVAAGGVSGIATVLAVLGVAAVPAAVTGDIGLRTVLFLTLIGVGVGGIVGSVLGLLFGLVDLALFRAAGPLVPTGREAPTATPDRQ